MSEYIVTCDEETASWIGNDVDSMKPIVRCRDCIWFIDDPDMYESKPFCDYLDGNGMHVEPDGFCSFGQRKESGDD